ncbi:Sulfate transport system permease protein CysW [Raoultella terrigena]|nr:Sulfate transport system permease protein CysW [Raoultella terrigena]
MAEVTQLKRYDTPRINWGKWFLIGTGMLVSAFILIVPMVYIFVQAFSKGLMPVLQNLADPDMLHAIWLTVMIALITVPVNLVFGTLLAWLVTRFTFPGRQLLLTLLDIPFAVSPVVAGWSICCFTALTARLAAGWMSITCKLCLPGRAWCWQRSS